MSDILSSLADRRGFLISSAAAGALSILPVGIRAAVLDGSIRPFRINIPEEALVDLRRRAAATRWPDHETVRDRSQGVQLEKLQELVLYWAKSYDWRKTEARLNALPQFVTEIDGLNIYFIHVRSRHPNALPLVVMHGWPGSVLELVKMIGPLTDPTAYGAKSEDAFDVIIPSMPGYGFSDRPKTAGWNPDRIGFTWDILMKRLGYDRYVAQGGDWGAAIANSMARQAPRGLLGIHVNLPAAVPMDILKAIGSGEPPAAGLSDVEKTAFEAVNDFFIKRRAYSVMMATRPQTVGYGIADSPSGLAAWMYDYNDVEPQRLLTKDQVLDDITLYWLTNTAASSARLYWENNNMSPLSAVAQQTAEISIPVGVTVFPDEIYRAPKSWVERAYRNLIYFNEVDKGGHFAAWEQPDLLSVELRSAFRSLRQSS